MHRMQIVQSAETRDDYTCVVVVLLSGKFIKFSDNDILSVA